MELTIAMYEQSKKFSAVEKVKPPNARIENDEKGIASSDASYHNNTQNLGATEDACVNRIKPQFGSPYDRFLHWMVNSRNVSSDTKELERRTCPMLWCRKICSDQKELFEHVKGCHHLSSGEYWCPFCSKAEELHSKNSEETSSRQLSEKELGSCLVEGAKKMFLTLGIGCVTRASRRTIPLSAGSYSSSFSDETVPNYASVSGMVDQRAFPPFFEQRTHPFTPSEPRKRSWQAQSCAKYGSRYQSFGLRPTPTPQSTSYPAYPFKAHIPPPISSFGLSWTLEREAVLFPKIPQNDWHHGHIGLSSTFQQDFPIEKSVFSFGSTGDDNPPVGIELKNNTFGSPSAFLGFSDDTDLVQIFWDVLQEHVSISKEKVAHLHGMHAIRQLTSMPSKEIALEGFRTLRYILEGEQPTTLSSIYAIVHLTYTSLAIAHEGNASNFLKDMFVSVSRLGTALISPERDTLEKVINAIWSVPIQADHVGYTSTELSVFSKPHKPGAFMTETCTHFLDFVERKSLRDQSSLETLGCQDEEFRTVAKLDITVPLMSAPSLEAFVKSVASVEKQVEQGKIKSIRGVELALIYIANTTSQSQTLYELFLRTVSQACNNAHNRLFQCGLSHTEYHLEDITFLLEELTNIEERQASSNMYSTEWPNSMIAASPISFTSPSTASSTCTTTSSPTFAFSPSSYNSTKSSNATSFSSMQISTTRGSTPCSTSLTSSTSTTKIMKCPTCGYEPDASGIQKWKAGNLKRHMRSTHNGKRYECTFEGCGRVFVGRKDNLISHQRDKGHSSVVQPPFFLSEDEFEMDEI